MKKLYSLALLSLVMAMVPVFAHATTANDVYRALKKIEARVQVGIGLRDYLNAIGDAQLEMNMFLDKYTTNDIKNMDPDKPQTKLMIRFNSAITAYTIAGKAWNYYGGYVFLPVKDKAIKTFMDAYPESKKFIGVRDGKKEKGYEGFMNKEVLLSVIWSKASSDLSQAGEMLAQMDTK